MCDPMFDDKDPFRRRLKDALERVPRANGMEQPAAEMSEAANRVSAPRDEFGDRLMRAVERTRGAVGNGEPASQRPAIAGQAAGRAAEHGERDVEASDDLRLVVQSWPELPPFVKSFIVTMVQANRKPQAAA